MKQVSDAMTFMLRQLAGPRMPPALPTPALPGKCFFFRNFYVCSGVRPPLTALLRLTFAFGRMKRISGEPAVSRSEPMEAACPIQIVQISGRTYCIVS